MAGVCGLAVCAHVCEASRDAGQCLWGGGGKGRRVRHGQGRGLVPGASHSIVSERSSEAPETGNQGCPTRCDEGIFAKVGDTTHTFVIYRYIF